MNVAQKEMMISYLSFDTFLLCGRDNYKCFVLFTDFLLLTYRPMACKVEKRKLEINDLPSDGLLQSKARYLLFPSGANTPS